MEYPKYRLFDAISHQMKHFSKDNTLNAKVNGVWKSYGSKEIQELVNKLSAALISQGVGANNFTPEGSDKIAIISNNRPEWVFTDLAVQQTGAILVPIYPTTGPQELEFILKDSEAKYLFVSSKELLEKVQSINTPFVKAIYTFDHIPGADHYGTLFELATEELLQQVEEIKSTIPNTHLATIIYTSGTTGTPKGVMLRHSNIVSNVYFSKASFPFPDAPHLKVLSFLPLNHIFEKMITYLYLFSGIGIYYAESMDTIADNLKEVKPDGFTTVPRLLEKVYEKIMAKGSALTGIKRKLFFWSVELGMKYDNHQPPGGLYGLKLGIARKLVFRKWREALGNNISFIITGGAAASEKLLRVFNAAGIPVYEGYGPTENSPVICVNRKMNNETKFGTVGPPIEGIEVKLADDGEILTRGPSMMEGYYKRPDLTAEVIMDGWLHTGDIGTIVDNRYYKITDRKKELFKTSGGKYVAPQPIENKMKESKFIEQIIVLGSERKFVSALIVPTFSAVREWMKENNIADQTNEAIVKNEAVNNLFISVIDHHNSNFNHVEQIKKFALLPNEWSVDGGEMTPKLSLKRKVIMEKFKDTIEGVYS
ncbi:MAG TPA: long-chain fatty acid--CoA ligase [Niabella sp.]|nr:long-chain fatty acid--CoA ligase [Niabella sp.]HOZ96282.1 long-chain fatty acid--CoA ligase [Niabella sp.]HQW14644.1 long-chain fatty acid--CoA ligase [Niabella sp.]HQX19783.1 long-chain fatty acid--CoA ligase [Niabella sp.]HQX41117.1 long-chain fatty acid--CoA ligase [Niabella sp.]